MAVTRLRDGMIVLTPRGCLVLIRGDLRDRRFSAALRHTGWLASVVWRDLRGL